MSRKAVNVTVVLHVQAVTCPGSFLCTNGRMSLQVTMFGQCYETNSESPRFPLLFHEKFVFRKSYPGILPLTDLNWQLSQEDLYCQLLQYYLGTHEPTILATYRRPLADLLFPASQPGLETGADVSLLMAPTCKFTGKIAPKLEVSTRTVIEDVIEPETNIARDPYFVTKTLSSLEPTPQRAPAKNRTNATVCHAQLTRFPKVLSPSQKQRKESPASSSCHHCQSGDPRPCVQPGSPLLRSDRSSPPLDSSRSSSPASCQAQRRRETKPCTCPKDQHMACQCPVCSKYMRYFCATSPADCSHSRGVRCPPPQPLSGRIHSRHTLASASTSPGVCETPIQKSRLMTCLENRVQRTRDRTRQCPFFGLNVHGVKCPSWEVSYSQQSLPDSVSDSGRPKLTTRGEFYLQLKEFYDRLYHGM